MTYNDPKSRSWSTIHILKLRHMVGNPHTKLEDSSLIITRVIKYNVKLGQ
jgi:hypothetical protein